MSFVEEPHGRHETDALPGRASLFARTARFGDRRRSDHRSPPSTSRTRASSRPLSRSASVASARYAACSSVGSASRWRADRVGVAACHRPGEGIRGAECLDVVDGRSHERPERFRRNADVTREPASPGPGGRRDGSRRSSRPRGTRPGLREPPGWAATRARSPVAPPRRGRRLRTTTPGGAPSPASTDGNDCSGCNEPTSHVGPRAVQLVELVERARARQVDHQRARFECGSEGHGRLRDGGVGRGDDDEIGAAPGLGDVDRRHAEPGRDPLGRWRVDRSARDRHRCPPACRRARPRRSYRRVRAPRGRASVAFDAPRQSFRIGLFVLASSFRPGEGAGLLGQHQC